MTAVGEPAFRVVDAGVRYAMRDARRIGAEVHALADVTLDLAPGRVMGLVGETGSGKTTLGRLLLRLLTPTHGIVEHLGSDLFALNRDDLAAYRRRVQAVFQDPRGSLSPRRSVKKTLEEPLRTHGLTQGMAAAVEEVLASVGLDPVVLRRYPHELSGGQAQRVAIARALIVDPRYIVCDEPVASLDASIQAQIVNLLRSLHEERSIGMLFISHDLAVVRHLADDISVLYRGRLMETGPAEHMLARPQNPYTASLIAAAPTIRGDRSVRRRLRLHTTSVAASPVACPLVGRCWLYHEMDAPSICREVRPELQATNDGGRSACHFSGQFEGVGTSRADRTDGGQLPLEGSCSSPLQEGAGPEGLAPRRFPPTHQGRP